MPIMGWSTIKLFNIRPMPAASITCHIVIEILRSLAYGSMRIIIFTIPQSVKIGSSTKKYIFAKIIKLQSAVWATI